MHCLAACIMQCISKRLLSYSAPLRRGSINSRSGLSSSDLACNLRYIAFRLKEKSTDAFSDQSVEHKKRRM